MIETANLDKYYTQLDLDLQQLAAVDWPAFVKLVGEDAITGAKVCILKSRGKSLNQIASKFSRSKGWVQHISDNKCKPCMTKEAI